MSLATSHVLPSGKCCRVGNRCGIAFWGTEAHKQSRKSLIPWGQAFAFAIRKSIRNLMAGSITNAITAIDHSDRSRLGSQRARSQRSSTPLKTITLNTNCCHESRAFVLFVVDHCDHTFARWNFCEARFRMHAPGQPFVSLKAAYLDPTQHVCA